MTLQSRAINARKVYKLCL